MANDKDAKRRKKLALKKRQAAQHEVTPYTGTEYQSDSWQPFVQSVDAAVYDAMLYSQRQLKNSTVKYAFETLVRRLRKGEPPYLTDNDELIPYSADNEVEYLVQDIRRKWTNAMLHLGRRSADGMIGVLRTLLFSIEAHGANTQATGGYVGFVWDFLKRVAEPGKPAPIIWTASSRIEEVESDEQEFER